MDRDGWIGMDDLTLPTLRGLNYMGQDFLWNLSLIPASVVLTALPTP